MRAILSAVILLLVVQAGFTQTFNTNLATKLQDTLSHYVGIISNIKGMSASVYLPGHGIWKGVAGVSHLGQPITPEMGFGIASNSKLFASVAMLKLAESDVINLDDSLSEWLPLYPNIDPNITVRQLLNHTSGVQDPIFLNPWMDTIMDNPTRTFTPAEVLSWVGAPLFPAGTSYGYSNVNYILAGMVAQSATGFHISRIIRDSILTPLGLDSTFYDVEEADRGVLAHRWFNTVDYNDTSRVGLNSAGGAAGSIFSTSGEMAQWYNALMSGQVINENSLAEMTTFLPTPGPYAYGLGILEETFFGQTLQGHSGSTWGYKSKMIYDPCTGAVVCGLANSFPAGMDGVTVLLYKILVDVLPACPQSISGTTPVCQGQTSVTYTVPAIANSTSYVWTLPPGATGTSNTNSITVDFSGAAVSGDITVQGVNSYGEGGLATYSVVVNPVYSFSENHSICKGETYDWHGSSYAVAGSYADNGSSAAGCDSSCTLTLVVDSLDGSVSTSGLVLTANEAGGIYQWLDCDLAYAPISGETSQSFNVAANGSYAVQVTRGACSDTSACIEFTTVGILENDATTFSIAPNPSNGEFKLVLPQAAQLSIYNSLGDLVYNERFVAGIHRIVLSEEKGMYYMNVQNHLTFSRKKLVVE